MTGDARCKFCGARIVYARNMDNGKIVPLDQRPALYQIYHQEQGLECERLGGEVAVNHHAT